MPELNDPLKNNVNNAASGQGGVPDVESRIDANFRFANIDPNASFMATGDNQGVIGVPVLNVPKTAPVDSVAPQSQEEKSNAQGPEATHYVVKENPAASAVPSRQQLKTKKKSGAGIVVGVIISLLFLAAGGAAYMYTQDEGFREKVNGFLGIKSEEVSVPEENGGDAGGTADVTPTPSPEVTPAATPTPTATPVPTPTPTPVLTPEPTPIPDGGNPPTGGGMG